MPFLSGIESSRHSLATRGVLRSVRMFLAGLHDRLRAAIGLSPGYLPVAGLPGQLAFMPLAPDELALYYSKHPKKYEVGAVHKPLHFAPHAWNLSSRDSSCSGFPMPLHIHGAQQLGNERANCVAG